MIKHPATYLSDNYRTDEDSGNYKLLSIGHLEHLELLKAVNDIELSRDIDEAYGFTLDKAGKNVLELRNGKDDELFRQSIKLKFLSNLSAGTIEDLNAVCEVLFGENFSYIKETWNLPECGYEPGALILSVISNPDSKSEFSENMKRIIQSSKAAGIAIYFYVCLNIYFAKNKGGFIFCTFNTGAALENDFSISFEKFSVHAFINGVGLWATLFNGKKAFNGSFQFNQTNEYKLQERVTGPYLSYSPQSVENDLKFTMNELVVHAAFFYWKRKPVLFDGKSMFDGTFLFDQRPPGLDFITFRVFAGAANKNNVLSGATSYEISAANNESLIHKVFNCEVNAAELTKTSVSDVKFSAFFSQSSNLTASITKDSMYLFDSSYLFNSKRRFNAAIVKEVI